ncbi:hypothetical protein H0A36_11510 [Endozoicomonas sp. SM1973]|uniref:Uncharacterized protein n=1 Tax=Spartinivicinus marinus TaxID=2994442 RepID=A0A853IGF8_9GAMM|nr:hypothetical protein [Spartinivicinus marinus]MCX4027666.1 hypothetical protein [Spartinivicinus marinus]NYZ66636.1 hypothetical protein [Spartinivicinus marinus]
MKKIAIEGSSLKEVLNWPAEYFDSFVLVNKPIVFTIGSAEVLGQFAQKETELIVELAQIDGGGEGVLPTIAKVAKYIAKLKQLSAINCIVHAIDCAKPNLKLREHLEKTGFVITNIPGIGEAYYKKIIV